MDFRMGPCKEGVRTVDPVVKEEEVVQRYLKVLFLGVRVDRIARVTSQFAAAGGGVLFVVEWVEHTISHPNSAA